MKTQEILNNLNKEVAFLVTKLMAEGSTLEEAKAKTFDYLEINFPEVVNVFVSQFKEG